MSRRTYYQRNKEVLNDRAKKCYHNNKKVLTEKARNKYRELTVDEKNNKRKYGTDRYHNMSDDKKQKLKEYQKNYQKTKNEARTGL